MIRRERHSERGLTLVEVILVLAISTIVLTVLARLLTAGLPISKVSFLQARSTETARLQLRRIAKSMREARLSDTGGYPLVVTEPNRFIFYADIDGDAATERVRYELAGTSLQRGITKPSGNPLEYDVINNEKTQRVASSIRNGGQAVFTYYTGDYPVDTNPLSPTDLTEVKYVQFMLLVDADPNVDPPPVEVRSQVQLRNLKTNLGEQAQGGG